MHERSLVAALVRQVHDVLVQNNAVRAVAVHVSIGEFSGVDAELFRTAFDEIGAAPLAGARLEVKTVDLEARCDGCGETFAVERFSFICPNCGRPGAEVVRGERMLLESVTVEGDQP